MYTADSSTLLLVGLFSLSISPFATNYTLTSRVGFFSVGGMDSGKGRPDKRKGVGLKNDLPAALIGPSGYFFNSCFETSNRYSNDIFRLLVCWHKMNDCQRANSIK